jgi:hypothetical protein
MSDELIYQNEVSSLICFNELCKVAHLIMGLALLRLDKIIECSSAQFAASAYDLPHKKATCDVWVKTTCHVAFVGH